MMSFNTHGFMSQALVPRTATVAVPGLRAWYDGLDDADVPYWTVRGLSASELAVAAEAAANQHNMAQAVEAIISGAGAEQVDGIKQALGLKKDGTPQDTVKRLEMLVAGSVEPEVNLQLAVKLAAHYPIEFLMITGKIVALTGQGSEPGKR